MTRSAWTLCVLAVAALAFGAAGCYTVVSANTPPPCEQPSCLTPRSIDLTPSTTTTVPVFDSPPVVRATTTTVARPVAAAPTFTG